MATGWAKDGAIQEQIDATISDEISRVRSKMLQTAAESEASCQECGNTIPEARRLAVPGVRLCIECQSQNDTRAGPATLFNRRGSKDSQLR